MPNEDGMECFFEVLLSNKYYFLVGSECFGSRGVGEIGMRKEKAEAEAKD